MTDLPRDVRQFASLGARLAFFIHGDEKISAEIVRRALARVRQAAATQDKRLYYEPGHGVRTRAWLAEIHLLQQLVCAESEAFERKREEAEDVTSDQLLIHYITHLVRITIARNSFFVNVGISRLLRDYTTAETMEIDRVVHGDEALPLPSYYRSRKALLMRELKDRFRDRLTTGKGPYGDRFERLGGGAPYVALVNSCLEELTPWRTQCWNDRKPRPADDLEIERMHAVLHPPCYRRLAAAAFLDDPDRRL